MKDNYLRDIMKNRSILFCYIFIVFFFTSCNFFKLENRKLSEDILPKTFSVYSNNLKIPKKWWLKFNDPELNNLIDMALSQNLSIKEAQAKFNQAKSVAQSTKSGLFPDLTGKISSGFSRQKIKNEKNNAISSEDYSMGLLSSYEIDIWGKVRSQWKADKLKAMATHESSKLIAISIASEVARCWTEIISQRIQLFILKKQLDTNKTYQELIELRFRKGIVSVLDIYQQKQIIESIKAQIPLVKQKEQLLMNELAFFLGEALISKFKITRNTLPVPYEIPETGIPANLLSNRPDIRSAGYFLRAYEWQLSAAKANRLPSINLTAMVNYNSNKLSMIFDNWLLNLSTNLATPLFDAQKRTSEVNRLKAVVDEKFIYYKKTVLMAIKEVEDLLIKETRQREYLNALQLEYNTTQKAKNEAYERYLKGLNTYLPVLTHLVSMQKLERDIIVQKTMLIIYRINLYKSLGGNWIDELF